MEENDFDGAAARVVARISEALRRELTSVVDDVEASDHFCEWHHPPPETRVIDGVERTVHIVPYPRYTPEVERLRHLIGAAGLVIPFDWMRWDGFRRYADGAGLATAPVADAVRVITAVVRSERFGDGSIDGALENGVLIAAVRRVLAERPN